MTFLRNKGSGSSGRRAEAVNRSRVEELRKVPRVKVDLDRLRREARPDAAAERFGVADRRH
jgi:hypothetical protein